MEIKRRNFRIVTIALFWAMSLQNGNREVDAVKFPLAPRFANVSVGTMYEFIVYSNKYQPLNLGLGFPDFNPPEFLKDALKNVSVSQNALNHQYTRAEGHPRLVKAIAKLYSKVINRTLDPFDNVIATIGATEGLHSIYQAFTLPGDEWIVFEPYFELYYSMLTIAGAKIKYMDLQPVKSEDGIGYTDWTFDKKKLESLFSNRTKAILLNNPHNPTGKVFTLEELEFIADLAKKWNVLVVADEVYEWLVYDGRQQVRIATLPGMFERTITVCSASKTYSATGWRIGWMYGPADIINLVKVVHYNTVLTDTTPVQEALAVALERMYDEYEMSNSFLKTFPKELQYKRDQLVRSLIKVGMTPNVPQSGYFILSDWTALESKIDPNQEEEKYPDFRFAKWMIRVVGLGGIPGSAYYSEENRLKGGKFIRYCFAKNNETLQNAELILSRWK